MSVVASAFPFPNVGECGGDSMRSVFLVGVPPSGFSNASEAEAYERLFLSLK